MRTLYTDASFDWRHTDETDENVVRGKIAVSDGKALNVVEKVAVGKVEGLRQYINIMELIAIARAVELASLEEKKEVSLAVYTDSRVAMIWASAGKVSSKVATEAHSNAIEYLRKARIQFGGIVTFNHLLRDNNPAGHILAEELEREKPHAL